MKLAFKVSPTEAARPAHTHCFCPFSCPRVLLQPPFEAQVKHPPPRVPSLSSLPLCTLHSPGPSTQSSGHMPSPSFRGLEGFTSSSPWWALSTCLEPADLRGCLQTSGAWPGEAGPDQSGYDPPPGPPLLPHWSGCPVHGEASVNWRGSAGVSATVLFHR